VIRSADNDRKLLKLLRLLILNQFFYPDHSATSQLMTDLAESLAACGDEVTVVAGRGLYNGGGGLDRCEEYRGVRVERAWATGFGKSSVAGRLCDYLTFYVGAAVKLFSLPRHEVVMALTTPPLIGLPALAACRLRGMRFVSLVQDVYPDVGIALGAFRRGGLLTRALDLLNRIVLRGADRVIVLGECMREVVASKGVAEDRTDVIHNWADGRKIAPLAEGERNSFAEEQRLAGRFVVLFSGNFGRVNDFSTPLEAARLLKSRQDVLFLFVGDGAKADEIRKFVNDYGLENVRALPYQPRESLRHSLAAGDAHLVTLAPGLAGLSVPSKTYGILAAGRPVLFVGDPASDIARIIRENGCGAVVTSGDAGALAHVVESWADDRSLAERMGLEARALFERRFDRAHAVVAYRESLKRCLSGAPRRLRRGGRVRAVKQGN
jgi:colanic acid biosynthesis glycosyl transferase WcaI